MKPCDQEDLHHALKDREAAGLLRKIDRTTVGQRDSLVDFASNDYLGLCRDQDFQREIHKRTESLSSGSTGARLISGDSPLYHDFEELSATFFSAERSILFNAGYVANIGLLSSVPTRHDTIILDQFAHASLFDGSRLSHARVLTFSHNDLEDLKKKLEHARGRPYVVVESLYSMDGDTAPLTEICDLAQQFGARVIVDEAHGGGTLGPGGRGLVAENDLQSRVFARIFTLGKAFGSHGAVVCGSELLGDYLVNFARPFVYTTSLSEHNVVAAHLALERLLQSDDLVDQLQKRIACYLDRVQCLPAELSRQVSRNRGPVQYILIPGTLDVVEQSERFSKEGYYLHPVRTPTVPADRERLRISLHAFNRDDEIRGMLSCLKETFTETL